MDGAYTIFAQSMDRTDYARGTLAARAGLAAPVPALDQPECLSMTDMMGAMGVTDSMGGGMAGMNRGGAGAMMHGMRWRLESSSSFSRGAAGSDISQEIMPGTGAADRGYSQTEARRQPRPRRRLTRSVANRYAPTRR